MRACGSAAKQRPGPTDKCSRKSFGAVAARRSFCRLPAAIAMMFLLPGDVDCVEEQPEGGVRLAAMLRPEANNTARPWPDFTSTIAPLPAITFSPSSQPLSSTLLLA